MTGCAFCDRKNFESQVVHETDLFLIVAAKGQLTDGGHLLIIPKEHITCTANLDGSKIEKFCALIDTSLRVIACEYEQKPAMYEHGFADHQTDKHARWHIFPGSGTDGMTARIRKDLPVAEIDCLGIYPIPFENHKEGEPYLFWETENDAPFVCWNPQEVTPQYLRIVVAELLGRPERANWRTMDRELDNKLIAKTITRLKPRFV